MRRTPSRIGLSLAAKVAVAWVGMTYAAAERGTPFCPSKLRFASREDVVRQGAWSYMLNKEPVMGFFPMRSKRVTPKNGIEAHAAGLGSGKPSKLRGRRAS